MADDKKIKTALVDVVKRATETDKAMREKFEVGDKFKFVREQLEALRGSVEEKLADFVDEVQVAKETLAEDETYVYVHLVNLQGADLHSWQKFVHPSVFHEYSVNRPIYADKAHIESALRSKEKKQVHGFLTMRLKQSDVLESEKQDSVGNPLVTVREGTLKHEQCVSFTHEDKEYTVDKEGQLRSKE